MNFGKNVVTTVISNAVAAATTDIDADSVDMRNFESVMFIVTFGTITATAVTSIKAQQSSDNSSFVDLAGTAQTVADDDDNLAFIIDIVKPAERYVKPYVDRGTANAVIESIIAIQYGPRKAPVTNGATIGGSETHVSPAEGTA